MLSQNIWWGSIAVEILLLLRMYRGNLAGHYPIFYSYISFVLLQSLFRFVIYRWDVNFYPYVYWSTEFLGVFAGCAVVFEICKVALSQYPGTARMARNSLGFVFMLTCTKVFLDAFINPRWRFIGTTMDLERSLRVVQAVAILALIALFLFYSIPFGRNLRGILLGYGLFVGVSVVQLTFASSAGTSFDTFWSYVHPISYDIALVTWAGHLWSYEPTLETNRTVELEQQYQRVAATTSQRLRAARGYLEKVVRP